MTESWKAEADRISDSLPTPLSDDTWQTFFDRIAVLPEIIKYDGTTDSGTKFLSRVAYRWICKNIKYDYKLWEPVSHLLYPPPAKWDLETVFREKQAVCSGYTTLFYQACVRLGIPEVRLAIVEGIVKSSRLLQMQPIVLSLEDVKPDHPWNAVCTRLPDENELQPDPWNPRGEWELIDCTAGAVEDTSAFEENFFADKSAFLSTHFPKRIRWQLINPPMPWDKWIQTTLQSLKCKDIVKLKSFTNEERLSVLLYSRHSREYSRSLHV